MTDFHALARRNSHTTGHTGPYHGGSIRLSVGGDMESGKAEGVEEVVAQGMLNRRVPGHAPEARRRSGRDRRPELRDAAAAQFLEAILTSPPLPPKI